MLTAKSSIPNRPAADLIVFGERWDVAEGTFRPPVSVFFSFFGLIGLGLGLGWDSWRSGAFSPFFFLLRSSYCTASSRFGDLDYRPVPFDLLPYIPHRPF